MEQLEDPRTLTCYAMDCRNLSGLLLQVPLPPSVLCTEHKERQLEVVKPDKPLHLQVPGKCLNLSEPSLESDWPGFNTGTKTAIVKIPTSSGCLEDRMGK